MVLQQRDTVVFVWGRTDSLLLNLFGFFMWRCFKFPFMSRFTTTTIFSLRNMVQSPLISISQKDLIFVETFSVLDLRDSTYSIAKQIRCGRSMEGCFHINNHIDIQFSEMSGLCLMKWPSEKLHNFAIFYALRKHKVDVLVLSSHRDTRCLAINTSHKLHGKTKNSWFFCKKHNSVNILGNDTIKCLWLMPECRLAGLLRSFV